MLVTKMAKTVTNISKLSPTYFVSNIRHQHRCSRCRFEYFIWKINNCQLLTGESLWFKILKIKKIVPFKIKNHYITGHIICFKWLIFNSSEFSKELLEPESAILLTLSCASHWLISDLIPKKFGKFEFRKNFWPYF